MALAPRAEYTPGVCNIGPAEIARRRRSALVGLVVTVITLVVLIVLRVPHLARLIVALPAAGTAVACLQVVLKFCVAFGSRGVFNFADLGQITEVRDAAARAGDRARAMRMILAGLAIGLAAGILAVLLPL